MVSYKQGHLSTTYVYIAGGTVDVDVDIGRIMSVYVCGVVILVP